MTVTKAELEALLVEALTMQAITARALRLQRGIPLRAAVRRGLLGIKPFAAHYFPPAALRNTP